MIKNVLVTGGAGFIGSFIVDALVERGHRVRILDNLEPQVHGIEQKKPDYLNSEAEFILGDIRDLDTLTQALKDIDVVFHEAASVGVGQSMYQVKKYVEVNTLGMANLLDIIVNRQCKRLEKMIIPSSMSIYGEGAYGCESCGTVYPSERSIQMLKNKKWNPDCPLCDGLIIHKAVTEDKPLVPTSVYAITKRDQEELAMSVGKAYGISTFALRYFNVYGPRQALNNPYTGVAAIFCGNLLRGKPPYIYEDGNQLRDFVHISDIVRTNLLCMEENKIRYGCYNVGSGSNISVYELAVLLARKMGSDIEPVITNKYRVGDIRHCYADVSALKRELKWKPEIKLNEGISDLIEWVAEQTPSDEINDAMGELDEKGLVK